MELKYARGNEALLLFYLETAVRPFYRICCFQVSILN